MDKRDKDSDDESMVLHSESDDVGIMGGMNKGGLSIP